MDGELEDPHGAPCPECDRTLWSSPIGGEGVDWKCHLCGVTWAA